MAAQARIDGKYVKIIFQDGSRSLVPVGSLSSADLAWLKEVSEYQKIKPGGSMVTVAAPPPDKLEPKKTLLYSKVENGIEQVQLCSPRVFYDQIGGTCMLYARVHWLDIAGYYTTRGEIYKIINGAPPNSPWQNPNYVTGLSTILYDRDEKPQVHPALPYGDNFAWAREQLRKGRPILAALPSEIWQALPSDYVASVQWNGGSIGHQIVVNGYTYDPKTDTGSFHVVNTWAGLEEFELKLRDARNGNLVFEHSMSPYGEIAEVSTNEKVTSVTLLKSVGSSHLYLVQTNKGTHRIVAPDEATVRRLVEEAP